MKNRFKKFPALIIIFLTAVLIFSCGKNDNGNNGLTDNNDDDGGNELPNIDTNSTGNNVYDIDANGIPKFVKVNYIELEHIYQISKFRSAIGHDYADSFESCRSMKHYYQPKSGADWSAIKIFSPVKGKVSRVFAEWAGSQVQITSDEYPAFVFILFHVNLITPLKEGDQISEGQQIGTHIGSQTMSDITVRVTTPKGWKLISYFDVMDDSIFQIYQSRGINSRSNFIISKEERDADTLNCNGETFFNSGTIDNWVVLN
ncbi:MAG: hypothetical protein F9K45_00180 [Melioribacteraceae bacterium]|nr:MAG: hypothetical protein F9K45_00180 [Melioribacteraceae bacterium]